MELTNDFRVGISPETAWQVLNDVERIAPCLPGAQLQEVEGDEFRGIVKVKVGPITAQYKGKATFLEQDKAAGRVVLKASGRDTGGGGNANATITATMVADGDGTRVTVVTDLAVTGRLAQFGRGVLAEVSTKLLGQFVDCLEHNVLANAEQEVPMSEPEPQPEATPPKIEPDADATPPPDPDPVSEPDGAPETAAADESAAPTEPTAAAGASEPPQVRRFDGPDVEPVDLLEAAGSSVAKRVLPPLAAAAGVLLAIVVWRHRHNR